MNTGNAAGLLFALVLLSGGDLVDRSLAQIAPKTDTSRSAPARLAARDPAKGSAEANDVIASAPASQRGSHADEVTAAPESQLVPFQSSAASAQQDVATSCELPGLPEKYIVYAAGAYSGRKLDYQIDQSGHEATQIDVAVNEPSAPVVLMLGAYEPTVWNIGWSPQTQIAGVLVSGYHRQTIAGLPVSVPRLNSSYDNKGACGYFYLSENSLDRINPMARRLFGQAVTRAFIANNGFVAVGTATGAGMVTDASQPPEQFRDRSAPLAGQAGLRDAVAKGLLREARTSDEQQWQTAYDAANKQDIPPVSGAVVHRSDNDRLHNGYVVLKAMRLPAGLYGANSATFIVPKGVPRPTGDPGHSQILDYNTMTCAGAVCGME